MAVQEIKWKKKGLCKNMVIEIKLRKLYNFLKSLTREAWIFLLSKFWI